MIQAPEARLDINKIGNRIRRYIVDNILWPRFWIIREDATQWGKRSSRHRYRYGYKRYQQKNPDTMRVEDLDRIIGYLSKGNWTSYILSQYTSEYKSAYDLGRKVSNETFNKHLRDDLTKVSVTIEVDGTKCKHIIV